MLKAGKSAYLSLDICGLGSIVRYARYTAKRPHIDLSLAANRGYSCDFPADLLISALRHGA